MGRVRNIWAFLRRVWADAPRLQREFRPDVVIASSTYPMDIWVARHLARPAGAKLVYEVHDLWPLSPIELSGMSRWHPFIRLVQAAEDAAYRDADVVVSMLPKVHELHGLARAGPAQAAHRAQRHRARRLAARRRSRCATTWPAALAAAREAGRMVVGYAGSMGLPNALDALLDAAALLRGVALQFVLVGDGHEKARLARRVADERLDNVTLLPPVPKAQIPSLLARHRHRLHRLAAGADLPLRHRTEQADGLHDGRRAGAAFGGRRQRPGGREPAAA